MQISLLILDVCLIDSLCLCPLVYFVAASDLWLMLLAFGAVSDSYGSVVYKVVL